MNRTRTVDRFRYLGEVQGPDSPGCTVPQSSCCWLYQFPFFIGKCVAHVYADSCALYARCIMILIVLYYVFTQIGMEGWSFERLKDLAQQIATIGMYYYALNEGDDFIS